MGDGSEEEGAVPAARIPSESPKQPAVMERREEKETPRDRDREMDRDRSPPRRFHDKHDAVENPGTVYVGRLSHETDERALRGFFETYGKVLDAKIVCDLETGASRGFAFVKFQDPRDAEDVLRECDGKIIDGRAIKINVARYPTRGGFSGGDRGGYGRGPPRGGYGGGFNGPHFGPPGRGRGGYGRDGGFRENFMGRRQPYERYEPRRNSRSPGRYAPRAESPGNSGSSRSRSPKKRASASPAPKRVKRVRSPVPERSRSPVAAAKGAVTRGRRVRRGSRSSSPGNSNSTYTSTEDGSASPARKAPAVGGPVSAARGLNGVVPFKKELMQSKRRESELATRVAALEAEVKAGRSAKQALQRQADDSQHQLQKNEEVLVQYRKWLGAVLTSAQTLVESKAELTRCEAEVAAREEDLGLMSSDAQVFMQKEERRAAKQAAKRGEKHKRLSEAGEADAHVSVRVGSAGHKLDSAGDTKMASDEQGGWGAEADEKDGDGMGEPAEDSVAAKFKPGIKFKLNQ